MKPTELRIGNIVKYNEEEYTIMCITHCATIENKMGWVNLPFTELKGVKLTEENIIKIGFYKNNTENNKTYSLKVSGNYTMNIYFNRFGIAKFNLNTFFAIEVKYIHQLQNIISALTEDI